MLKFFWKIINYLLLLFLIGAGAIAVLFYLYGSRLPNYQELSNYKPPIVTRLYANDGHLFAEYAAQRRIYIPVREIPPRLIQAFLAAEDKTFYTHFGIDIGGIVRASLFNIARLTQDKRPMGASTITQQVAKNFLLTEISNSISFERKIKEAILAFRIEKAYTKDYILELYLNEIYLGAGSYGVAAAALNYFNKALDELTIAETAFLAALPKGPSRYHPKKFPERAVSRRNYVIQRMYEDGHITKAEAETALHEPLQSQDEHLLSVTQANFFAEEVRRELLKRYGESVLYKEGLVVRTTLDPKLQEYAREALKLGLINYDRRHGWRGPILKVVLSAKNPLQQKEEWLSRLKSVVKPSGAGAWELAIVVRLEGDRAIIGGLEGTLGNISLEDLGWARRYHNENTLGPVIKHPSQVLSIGDVVLVERHKVPLHKKDKGAEKYPSYYLRQIPEVSGAIVVMNPHTGQVVAMHGGFSFEMSQFNRAIQAKRQPGSAFKTFIYLAALEKGLSPSTILKDEPISIDLGAGLGIWRPQNYNNDFVGSLTLRRALETSRNIPTINLVNEKIGMRSVVEIARRFNIVDQMPRQLAMVLGAGETTLLKMVTAYAMLANGGKWLDPIFIDRIQDRQGKTILFNTRQQCVGCHEEPSGEGGFPHLVSKIRQVSDPRAVYQLISFLEGVVLRGTGHKLKVLNRTVAAKTGTTNEYRDAWCIAFTPDLVVGTYMGFDAPRSLGKKEGGTRAASPIIVDFLQQALKELPDVPFKIPAGVKLLKVNPESGKSTTAKDKQAIMESFTSESHIEKLDEDDQDEDEGYEPQKSEKEKNHLDSSMEGIY